MSTRNPTALTMAAGILLLAVCMSRADELEAPSFQTSDRCLACHNGMTTASGADFSIGIDWRGSVMANSSRDPYWQASVRRETLDLAGPSRKFQRQFCRRPRTP